MEDARRSNHACCAVGRTKKDKMLVEGKRLQSLSTWKSATATCYENVYRSIRHSDMRLAYRAQSVPTSAEEGGSASLHQSTYTAH